MEEFAILMMLGIRVREVRDLREGHMYSPGRGILFVDSEMKHEDREWLADHLAARVAETSEATA